MEDIAKDGSKIKEIWYRHGIKHREGGPAEIEYKENGTAVKYQAWYADGKLHNVDGPAEEYDDRTEDSED